MTCVSRAQCNMTLFLRHVAVQNRDRKNGGVCYGPGSAAHHERARRRAQNAHAALRPGHTTDSLILGQALSLTLANFLTGNQRFRALFWDALISSLSRPSRDSEEIPHSPWTLQMADSCTSSKSAKVKLRVCPEISQSVLCPG